jgi:L,D-transpeptidase catalytic domain
MLVFPLLISVFLFVGFSQDSTIKLRKSGNIPGISDNSGESSKEPKINFSALLAAEEFSKNLRDTVYTDSELWLELRIDKQMLYAHYRDGRILSYPVSTGQPYASKSVESRPGLYAIFLKEEVHLSSQFNNARMNYYMPYNMGIGFHGLPGTGYYGHLGVRPSSHGCIRMRNEDVRVLFKQCDIGTLVLSHKGKSTRIVAFAPEGFKNDAEYSKDDYHSMLAYNLASLIEGKYFINPPKRFVLDGKVIPRSGINVSTTDNIPEKQLLPFAVAKIENRVDRLKYNYSEGKSSIREIQDSEFAQVFESTQDSTSGTTAQLTVNPEIIRKYVYNSIGILPYFPPDQ